MGDSRKLDVFARAHRLTLDIYSATHRYPQDEMFGLSSQTRQAAASIGSNLAEGSGRESDRELARFTPIALGSASELEYHLLLARDLGFLAPTDWTNLDDEVRRVPRMLASLDASRPQPATARRHRP